MPKQFKTARQINKLKVIEAADLYGVTTDFLLGRSETQAPDSNFLCLIR